MEYYKFIPTNQIGMDCQLVTSLNASIYLHKKRIIKPKSKKYKELIELVGCKYGSATSIEKSWPILKIKSTLQYENLNSIDFDELPIELKTYERYYGHHSTLIIDYNHWCDAVQILNFDKYTTSNGWIFLENLELYIPRDYQCSSAGYDKNSWLARSFYREK